MIRLVSRAVAALVFAFVLVACEVPSTGAINHRGQVIKTEISQIENGLVITGYDVYLNNELIGRTEPQEDAENPVFAKRARVPMKPLASRYGTVRIERNFAFGSTSFDVYIDDTYTGTIQMPTL
ncbi:hypothetical protein [uncultured Tateyamaria sp.]|uniref:hypothetical protein n=1 Tax=uncultured Tateyamaria sp. TaxID=455651 RepID=UPI00260A2C1E|nr:hypothetical protein [uncultured Tateyamaria sp.]